MTNDSPILLNYSPILNVSGALLFGVNDYLKRLARGDDMTAPARCHDDDDDHEKVTGDIPSTISHHLIITPYQSAPLTPYYYPINHPTTTISPPLTHIQVPYYSQLPVPAYWTASPPNPSKCSNYGNKSFPRVQWTYPLCLWCRLFMPSLRDLG